VDNFCSIGMQALAVNWVKAPDSLASHQNMGPPTSGRSRFILSEVQAVDFSKIFHFSSIPSAGSNVVPVKKAR
jgi:hypothetical protein